MLIIKSQIIKLIIFQVLFILALFIVSISAIPEGPPKHGGYDHHGPVHYNYEYKVHDDYHGTDFGHHESRDGHNTKECPTRADSPAALETFKNRVWVGNNT